MRYAGQKRTNGQRRFGLSHENAGRDVERLDTAGAHQAGHDAGRDPDDELHDPVMIENGEERGDKNDGRQDLEGEIKAVFRVLDAKFAEDELGTGKRIAQQPVDGLSGHAQGAPANFEFEHQKGEQDLQPESGDNGSGLDRPAIAGERKGQAEQHRDANQTGKSSHGVPYGETPLLTL